MLYVILRKIKCLCLCFNVYVNIDDIYKGKAEDVETRSDISNYELDRPLPKGKNKKVNCLMKN